VQRDDGGHLRPGPSALSRALCKVGENLRKHHLWICVILLTWLELGGRGRLPCASTSRRRREEEAGYVSPAELISGRDKLSRSRMTSRMKPGGPNHEDGGSRRKMALRIARWPSRKKDEEPRTPDERPGTKKAAGKPENGPSK